MNFQMGRATVFLAAILFAISAAHATISFTYLGGGEVSDISPDGSVVVGGNYDTGTNGVWDHGTFAPVSIPAPYLGAGPGGISADGTILVGSAWRFSPPAREAVRWNGLGNPTLLGDLPGGQEQAWANRCSADGSVAVGVGYDARGSQPVRWTGSGIERLSGGVSYYGGNATGVSADGSVIVGTIWLMENGPVVPYRWTQASGMQLLADPSTQGEGGASTITPDGSLIVGGIAGQAFRWTEQDGLQLLGMLDPQMPGAAAIATSADGSIVVGQSPFPFQQDPNDGFVWDATHGMRSLTQLITDLGFDLQGNTIEQADAISADGTIIAGRAFGTLGGQVFVLTLPEPGSLAALVAIPAMVLARRRRAVRSGGFVQNSSRGGAR